MFTAVDVRAAGALTTVMASVQRRCAAGRDASNLLLKRKQNWMLKFEFLTAVRLMMLKMTGFWHTAPCCLVEVGRRFRGSYCFYHQDDDGGRTHV
jgi:hypothetical protein